MSGKFGHKEMLTIGISNYEKSKYYGIKVENVRFVCAIICVIMLMHGLSRAEAAVTAYRLSRVLSEDDF